MLDASPTEPLPAAIRPEIEALETSRIAQVFDRDIHEGAMRIHRPAPELDPARQHSVAVFALHAPDDTKVALTKRGEALVFTEAEVDFVAHSF